MLKNILKKIFMLNKIWGIVGYHATDSNNGLYVFLKGFVHLKNQLLGCKIQILDYSLNACSNYPGTLLTTFRTVFMLNFMLRGRFTTM